MRIGEVARQLDAILDQFGIKYSVGSKVPSLFLSFSCLVHLLFFKVKLLLDSLSTASAAEKRSLMGQVRDATHLKKMAEDRLEEEVKAHENSVRQLRTKQAERIRSLRTQHEHSHRVKPGVKSPSL